jgi:hypothetical protein
MSVRISPNLPANVVEIGNEITQAKIDEINAGTLATQTWVSASYLTTSSASTTYAPKASPTFTGTVTIPSGASISGYLTSATASSTYQPLSGMSSYLTTASAATTYAPKASPTFTGTVTIPSGASISGFATESYVTSQGYLTDAPSNGNEYVRKNAAWAIASGGGGGVWGSITGTLTAQTDLTSYVTGLGYQTAGNVSTYVTGLNYITSAGLSVTNIDLTGNFNGYYLGSGNYTFKWTQSTNTLRMQNGSGVGTTLGIRGLEDDVYGLGTSGSLDFNTSSTIYFAGSYTLSVPADSSYDFPIGTKFFICAPSGSVIDNGMSASSINGGSSYTFPSAGVAVLIKVAANTWYIS